MSRFLLDTQALLWWLSDDPRLGAQARRHIATGAPLLSPASLWEIAIKAQIGKLEADVTKVCEEITAQGFSRLAIADRHLAAYAALPLHHRDPFDRMLVAQAVAEEMTLMTSDAKLKAYGAAILNAED